eukprot:622237-Pelagomonas_calceolata.AAC.1
MHTHTHTHASSHLTYWAADMPLGSSSSSSSRPEMQRFGPIRIGCKRMQRVLVLKKAVAKHCMRLLSSFLHAGADLFSQAVAMIAS